MKNITPKKPYLVILPNGEKYYIGLFTKSKNAISFISKKLLDLETIVAIRIATKEEAKETLRRKGKCQKKESKQES